MARIRTDHLDETLRTTLDELFGEVAWDGERSLVDSVHASGRRIDIALSNDMLLPLLHRISLSMPITYDDDRIRARSLLVGSGTTIVLDISEVLGRKPWVLTAGRVDTKV